MHQKTMQKEMVAGNATLRFLSQLPVVLSILVASAQQWLVVYISKKGIAFHFRTSKDFILQLLWTFHAQNPRGLEYV